MIGDERALEPSKGRWSVSFFYLGYVDKFKEVMPIE